MLSSSRGGFKTGNARCNILNVIVTRNNAFGECGFGKYERDRGGGEEQVVEMTGGKKEEAGGTKVERMWKRLCTVEVRGEF